MSKDLNKDIQVKNVNNKINTDIYSVNDEIIVMPNITALVIYLMKKYPNNNEFGKQVRKTVLSWKEK